MTCLNHPTGRFSFDQAGASGPAAAAPGRTGTMGTGAAASFEAYLAGVQQTGFAPLQLPLFCAHQMGTCRLGEGLATDCGRLGGWVLLAVDGSIRLGADSQPAPAAWARGMPLVSWVLLVILLLAFCLGADMQGWVVQFEHVWSSNRLSLLASQRRRRRPQDICAGPKRRVLGGAVAGQLSRLCCCCIHSLRAGPKPSQARQQHASMHPRSQAWLRVQVAATLLQTRSPNFPAPTCQVAGLYCADGSCFPTPTGLNPMMT